MASMAFVSTEPPTPAMIATAASSAAILSLVCLPLRRISSLACSSGGRDGSSGAGSKL